MGIQTLKNEKVTRVVNATAAGTTAVNGTVLDMQGFESVKFIACFGALTATQTTSLKIQQGTLANGSDMADLAGSGSGNLADGDGNKCIATELVRPTKRYVRCVVVRGTANAVIDAVIAVQMGGRKAPVTHDASVAISETVVSPAEGTA